MLCYSKDALWYACMSLSLHMDFRLYVGKTWNPENFSWILGFFFLVCGYLSLFSFLLFFLSFCAWGFKGLGFLWRWGRSDFANNGEILSCASAVDRILNWKERNVNSERRSIGRHYFFVLYFRMCSQFLKCLSLPFTFRNSWSL